MHTNAAPALQMAHNGEGKIRSAPEAVSLIRSGDTIATGGFVGIGFAEAVAIALKERVLRGVGGNWMGEAGGLTPRLPAGPGDGQGGGLDPLALQGLRRPRG